MGQTGQRRFQTLDSGYAWVVLAACSFIAFISYGTFKSFGVLYTELLRYFEGGSGSTAWIGGISSFLALMCGLVANNTGSRFSFRIVFLLGGILVFMGFLSSAFVPKIEIMFFTYGILAGLGFACCTIPSSTVLNFYFKKRRALANGVMGSSAGLGSFVFPFLYRVLFDTYGLSGALMVIAAIMLNACVAGALIRQPNTTEQVLEQNSKSVNKVEVNEHGEAENVLLTENDVKECDTRSKKTPVFNPALFKRRVVLLHVGAFLFALSGNMCALIVIPSNIRARQYTKSQESLAISVLGGAEMVGRLFFGWLADKVEFPAKHLLMVNAAMGGAFAFISIVVHRYAYMVTFAAVVGAFPGCLLTLFPVVFIEDVGLQDFPGLVGVSYMLAGIFQLIMAPLSGWLEDLTGDWRASFALIGACFLVAVILLLTEVLFTRMKHTSKSSKIVKFRPPTSSNMAATTAILKILLPLLLLKDKSY